MQVTSIIAGVSAIVSGLTVLYRWKIHPMMLLGLFSIAVGVWAVILGAVILP